MDAAIKIVTRKIKALLFEEWDPIGVADEAPRDEYDSYALRVVGMLFNGRPVDEIAAYLDSVESDYMGFTPSFERNRVVAAKAVAIYEGKT